MSQGTPSATRAPGMAGQGGSEAGPVCPMALSCFLQGLVRQGLQSCSRLTAQTEAEVEGGGRGGWSRAAVGSGRPPGAREPLDSPAGLTPAPRMLSAGRGPLPRSLAGAPWDRRANPSLSGWGSAWPCRMWGTRGQGLWLRPGVPLLGVNVGGSCHTVLNVGAHWPGPALPCGQLHPASEPTLGSPSRPAGPGPRVQRDLGTPGPPSLSLPWSLAPGPHPPQGGSSWTPSG